MGIRRWRQLGDHKLHRDHSRAWPRPQPRACHSGRQMGIRRWRQLGDHKLHRDHSRAGLGLSLALAIVVDRWVSVGGDSWETISSIETIVGLGLGLSLALAIVVDRWVSVGGDSWDTIGSIETIVGLGLGLSLAL